jgi:hypothetical protein
MWLCVSKWGSKCGWWKYSGPTTHSPYVPTPQTHNSDCQGRCLQPPTLELEKLKCRVNNFMSVHCDINKQRNACTSASILALCFSHRMALAASHHMNLATQRTNTSSTNTITSTNTRSGPDFHRPPELPHRKTFESTSIRKHHGITLCVVMRGSLKWAVTGPNLGIRHCVAAHALSDLSHCSVIDVGC